MILAILFQYLCFWYIKILYTHTQCDVFIYALWNDYHKLFNLSPSVVTIFMCVVRNPAIFNNMDESEGHYAKWKWPDPERQILYDLTYMWNLERKQRHNSVTEKNGGYQRLGGVTQEGRYWWKGTVFQLWVSSGKLYSTVTVVNNNVLSEIC